MDEYDLKLQKAKEDWKKSTALMKSGFKDLFIALFILFLIILFGSC